jgi:O-antigen/teichoic acid export membrane protein
MLTNVLKNFGSLTTMRVLSRLVQFIVKTYLIRTQLDH